MGYLPKLFLCYLISGPMMLLCSTPQRALLEQKQKKKRQEPLMVQSNVDGRSRARRTKQSEEQAPLVESYLSSNSSTIYHGEKTQNGQKLSCLELSQKRCNLLT